MLVREAHGLRAASEILVRHAHDGVLLVHHHGDAALLGGAGHRDAHVAAEADDAVGLHLVEPRARKLRGLLNLHDGFRQRHGVVAVEASGLERLVRNAGRRHQTRLDARGRARVEHLVSARLKLVG